MKVLIGDNSEEKKLFSLHKTKNVLENEMSLKQDVM